MARKSLTDVFGLLVESASWNLQLRSLHLVGKFGATGGTLYRLNPGET
jgi:hypothetical protein